ncbi:hypothetical protein JAAARDRAFT_703763 [Jaapia argillacea MUCL 33604]|uniref:ATPase AAA-type core domain-containing protein n=1 Tax=Jaapia argillacea MUCL 33604 TaxID=933084 RepID=A0A067PAB3_9AGAM|nr:hypothetical protein JAAARDRAFT_703763 [Jaapia argillacea MUCL 33604]
MENRQSRREKHSIVSVGRRRKEQLSDVNTLTLSGLPNALDGVTTAGVRLLFAATNHLERLDPVLSRPARMDVCIESKNTSMWQAELLFHNFIPSAEDEAIVEEDGDLDGIEPPNPPSPAPSSMFSLPSFTSSSTSWISSPSLAPIKAGSSSGSRRSRNGSVAPSDGASTPLPQVPAYLLPPVEESLEISSRIRYQTKSSPLWRHKAIISKSGLREKPKREREARELKNTTPTPYFHPK